MRGRPFFVGQLDTLRMRLIVGWGLTPGRFLPYFKCGSGLPNPYQGEGIRRKFGSRRSVGSMGYVFSLGFHSLISTGRFYSIAEADVFWHGGGYNFRIMFKLLAILVPASLIVTVVLVARCDKMHDAGKSYDIQCKQSGQQASTVSTLVCTIDHRQNAEQREYNPRWWHEFFAWPEGITALLVKDNSGTDGKFTGEGVDRRKAWTDGMFTHPKRRICVEFMRREFMRRGI